jgi:hypothetical protein
MLSRIEKRRQKGRQSEDVLFVVFLAYCSPKNKGGRDASEEKNGEDMGQILVLILFSPVLRKLVRR